MFWGISSCKRPGSESLAPAPWCAALLLYFGHYLVNLAGYEEVLLLVIGVVLLVIELAAFPGFGLFGVAGFLSIMASLAMVLMAGDWSDFTFEQPFHSGRRAAGPGRHQRWRSSALGF